MPGILISAVFRLAAVMSSGGICGHGKFIAACASGDLTSLLEVLVPDALGRCRPGSWRQRGADVVTGGERVARNLLRFWARARRWFPSRGRPADKIARHSAEDSLSELQTERVLLAANRVGQHVFALCVLNNCGSRCVFCGFSPATFGAKRMLLAGHIKPWKNSTPGERLDPRNGLADCPPHDDAFDNGLLTVNDGLRIHVARSDAVRTDQMARQYYGQPPLRESLLPPAGAHAPAPKYLDWHRQKIFQT
jgi:hypothetical protein